MVIELFKVLVLSNFFFVIFFIVLYSIVKVVRFCYLCGFWIFLIMVLFFVVRNLVGFRSYFLSRIGLRYEDI